MNQTNISVLMESKFLQLS